MAMHETSAPGATGDEPDYALLEAQLAALLGDERDVIANAANFSAFVFHEIPGVNWAGFYFPADDGLVLGPFAGKPACVRLPHGRGVCGAAFTRRETVVVDDVHAFVDHIACDSASRSEIVVPLLVGDAIAGVFDVDSPLPARFSARDRAGIERLVARFLEHTPMPARLRRAHACDRDALLPEALRECRDQHAQLAEAIAAIVPDGESPEAIAQRLRALRPLLLAHLRYEDDWLHPRLRAMGPLLAKKVERLRAESGDLVEHFTQLADEWEDAARIAADRARFAREWRVFAEALQARTAVENDDLFVAAETALAARM